jgi:hypothetical protein
VSNEAFKNIISLRIESKLPFIVKYFLRIIKMKNLNLDLAAQAMFIVIAFARVLYDHRNVHATFLHSFEMMIRCAVSLKNLYEGKKRN